ncbi:MAG: beta-lactamase family protein [Blastocatellia bacterium]|nr:beta-lactamase family protein [Blastocatellia bacterium]
MFADFDKPDSPGCAMAIVRDGQIAYARGYGMASLEHANPITPQTVFDIGSTSKQFAAACIHTRPRREAHARRRRSEVAAREMRDYGKPITIRHLLHHTSGIPGLPRPDAARRPQRDERLATPKSSRSSRSNAKPTSCRVTSTCTATPVTSFSRRSSSAPPA